MAKQLLKGATIILGSSLLSANQPSRVQEKSWSGT